MAKRRSAGHGRRRRRRDPQKEAFWRSILKEQVASGIGVRAFCRDKGLAEASFYHWRRELRRRRLEGKRFRDEATDRTAEARRKIATANASGQLPRRSATPAPAAKDGGAGDAADSLMRARPAFAEVRLPERPASEIEVRRGELSVFFRGGCDRVLLREALTILGGGPC